MMMMMMMMMMMISCERATKSVERSHESTIVVLWNQQVKTDKIIPNNKQDTIIHCNGRGRCLLVDITISGDRNVIKKEGKNLNIVEIELMWNVKTKVTRRATGTI